MRMLGLAVLTLMLASSGCPATSASTGIEHTPTSVPADSAADPQPGSSQPLELIPPDQVKPDRGVWAYLDGQRRLMDIDDARSLGFTIIDLSDSWVPYIFWSQTPGQEEHAPNEYAQTYVDLANDRINVDGVELRRRERNYLEVYGIPPTLSVLRQRFIHDAQTECFASLDRSVFEEYHGPIRVVDPGSSKRLRQRYHRHRADYLRARKKARVRTLEQLLEKPAYATIAKRYQRSRWRLRALTAMHKRLVCEGMYDRRPPRVKPGEVTWAVRQALKRFERKHNIYGWGMIFEDTAQALGRSPAENNFESLKRLIIERVVSAAGILEDGSRTTEYRGEDGQLRQVRDLVGEFGEAVLRHLGLTDSTRAETFMATHTEADFGRLLVAVQLPPKPDYYSAAMELKVRIARGDVWYDLPFDERGKRLPQPRQRRPRFTLYTEYQGQEIPLVHWRTTIGGWKREKRGDEEYYKYKVSDIGPRLWKNIVAGPVWVPPRNTPSVELVKRRRERVVAQSTFGPGYASAYGLVAAFHVRDDGFDNQIRTHGTVNYMSVRSGFSHGCHRLRNYRAVRLFSFLLRHRAFTRKGQVRLAYQHRFEHRGEEFQINLHTRGYYYEMTPPIPVNVTEGRIRGQLEEPVEEYVKKPGQMYQDDLPKVGTPTKPGNSGAPRTPSAKDNPLQQQQTL